MEIWVKEWLSVHMCLHACMCVWCGGEGALLFKSHSTGKLSVPHFQGQERLYSELITSDEIIQASKNNPEEWRPSSRRLDMGRGRRCRCFSRSPYVITHHTHTQLCVFTHNKRVHLNIFPYVLWAGKSTKPKETIIETSIYWFVLQY